MTECHAPWILRKASQFIAMGSNHIALNNLRALVPAADILN